MGELNNLMEFIQHPTINKAAFYNAVTHHDKQGKSEVVAFHRKGQFTPVGHYNILH